MRVLPDLASIATRYGNDHAGVAAARREYDAAMTAWTSLRADGHFVAGFSEGSLLGMWVDRSLKLRQSKREYHPAQRPASTPC
jgi:hypothetical protein